MISAPVRRTLVGFVALMLSLGLSGCSNSSAVDEEAWASELAAYREDRLQRLKQPHGWLSLIALHWLEEGRTTIGSAASSDLLLPEGAAAGRAAALELSRGQVTLFPLKTEGPEGDLRIAGEPVTTPVRLLDDSSDDVTYVNLGRLRMHILDRDGQKAVRVTDPESPVRTEFPGLEYFPADLSYVLKARFEPYDEPRTVEIPTVQGTISQMLVPGVIEFRLKEREFSLQVFVDELTDSELFVILRDETSGKGSYGAGRYLYVERSQNNVVWVDFNRAYNPPCAFTSFATCPLPPRQNWMQIPLEAGERNPKH